MMFKNLKVVHILIIFPVILLLIGFCVYVIFAFKTRIDLDRLIAEQEQGVVELEDWMQEMEPGPERERQMVGIAVSRCAIGTVLARSGDHGRAVVHFRQASALFDDLRLRNAPEDTRVRQTILLHLARAYLRTEQGTQAIQTLTGPVIEAPVDQVVADRILSLAYEQIGDTTRAEAYRNKPCPLATTEECQEVLFEYDLLSMFELVQIVFE